MGLDWRYLSLSSYLEALEAHNEAQKPDNRDQPPDAAKKLARFMRAHRDGGNQHKGGSVAKGEGAP